MERISVPSASSSVDVVDLLTDTCIHLGSGPAMKSSMRTTIFGRDLSTLCRGGMSSLCITCMNHCSLSAGAYSVLSYVCNPLFLSDWSARLGILCNRRHEGIMSCSSQRAMCTEVRDTLTPCVKSKCVDEADCRLIGYIKECTVTIKDLRLTFCVPQPPSTSFRWRCKATTPSLDFIS